MPDWLTHRIPCGRPRGLQESILRMMGLGEFRRGMCLKELTGLGSETLETSGEAKRVT